jgi:hypothetical protein
MQSAVSSFQSELHRGDLFHLSSEQPMFLAGGQFLSLPEQTWSSSGVPLCFFLRALSSEGAILSENPVLQNENEILVFFFVVLNWQVTSTVSDRTRGSSNRSRSNVESREPTVPSARAPSSVDYTTTSSGRRHDVRNKSPLRDLIM